MSDLKPCPHCNGPAHIVIGDEFCHTRCSQCGATGGPADAIRESDAIAAWNRRPTETPASGEREGEPRTDAMRRLLTEANARNGELRDALIDATAHLAAATSSYKRFCRKGVTGDALFSTKLSDYEKAEARARAVLRKEGK